MKLRISSGSVPAGSYMARFVGVESFESKEYGPGLRWKWEILGGACSGHIATRITGTSPSPKNACGRILAGLYRKPLQVDDVIDIDALVGQVDLIIVAQAENSTRVDAVCEPPKIERSVNAEAIAQLSSTQVDACLNGSTVV